MLLRKITPLQQTLYNKYQYRPSYFKVWEVKEKAIGKVFGDWDKSYQLLPKLLKTLTDSNPGQQGYLENNTFYYVRLCDIRESLLGFWSIN